MCYRCATGMPLKWRNKMLAIPKVQACIACALFFLHSLPGILSVFRLRFATGWGVAFAFNENGRPNGRQRICGDQGSEASLVTATKTSAAALTKISLQEAWN